MGRKAIDKERKPLNAKQQKWLTQVMPYFYKNGMRKPTMDDIAEHLNLSKATIYNYYSSKEDLIHDALWLKLVELQKFRDANTFTRFSENEYHRVLKAFQSKYVRPPVSDRCYCLMILLNLRIGITKALTFLHRA